MKRFLLAALALSALAVGLFLFSNISPIPRGALQGPVLSAPASDWSFAQDERFCQLEISAPEPRSVTVTCLVSGGQLYVGCSSCDGRVWGNQILENPEVRYGVLGNVYELRARHVSESAERSRVWQSRTAKYGRQNSDPVPDDFWFFELAARN